MKKEKSTLAGFSAASLAILGSITCCGTPIAAGILASVGIGASQLEFLHSIQYYLIGIAIVAIAFGFYKVYFQKKNSCCSIGSPSKLNRKPKVFLWITAFLTLGILILTLRTKVLKSEETCCPSQNKVKDSCCTQN